MTIIDDQQNTFQKISEILIANDLVVETNRPIIERIGRNIRLASRPRMNVTTHLEKGTLRERIDLAESGAFSIKLIDDALIQLMWEYSDNLLVKHRYAYLPSPLGPTINPMEEDITLYERLGSFVDEVADHLRLGGAFRIDYDKNAAGEQHPATHLTLFGPGLEEGRLPIKGPWCLGRFILFIFGSIAPPTLDKDGRRVIDQELINSLSNQIPLSGGPRTIESGHMIGPWLSWGKTG